MSVVTLSDCCCSSVHSLECLVHHTSCMWRSARSSLSIGGAREDLQSMQIEALGPKPG